MHRIIGGCTGFLLSLAIIYFAPIDNNPLANDTLAIAVLMIVWWVTNTFPFGLTALVPVIAFPLMHIIPIQHIANAYFHPLIFLFFGGFLIATAIQKWSLHKRIALHIILLIGTDLHRLVLGFMFACGFLSMWVSNTATTMMMLPIGLSVIQYIKTHDGLSEDNPFATLLMLSIAYSSSIGGMATIIGTAPNAFSVAFLSESYHINISFIQWFTFALPLVIIALPLSYLVLTRLAFKLPDHCGENSKQVLHQELQNLGPMTASEKIITVVFIFVVAAWVAQPWLVSINSHIADAGIALIGGGILFLLPAHTGKRILAIRDLKLIPWPVILLLGGGLALATAVKSSGLAQSIAQLFYFAKDLDYPVILLLVIITIIALSEFTSNMATTAAFIPIITTLATDFHLNPLLLTIPATLAASCAFMLPVATPPNAIIFGSRYVTIKEMFRAGIFLNGLFIVLLFVSGLLLELIL